MNTEPHNPYQPPQSEISASPTVLGGELASPWIRLGASIIDGLILTPINWILQKFILHTPTPMDFFKASQSGNPADIKSLMPSTGSILLSSVLGMVLFIALNFVFLQNGQTIGKKLLKLQVQRRADGTALPWMSYVLKRMLPIQVASILGVLVSPLINILLIVDSLMIFRAGRNTLHDDLAGSKVVRISA